MLFLAVNEECLMSFKLLFNYFCVCALPGYYCGNDGLKKDANNLYYCPSAGGTPSLHTNCAFTCAIMPHGSDDKCVAGKEN